MRTLAILITTPVVATLLFTGCGSKQKKEPAKATTSASTTTKRAPAVAMTEKATGELREALLRLRRVHFAFDTDRLLPESRTALEEAAERLRTYPKVHVYVDGHTDQRGTTEYNLALGDRRARAVVDYLANMGIAPERLHGVTFGKEQLSSPGTGEIDHARNRRADFRLMRGDVRLVVDEGVLYNDKGDISANN